MISATVKPPSGPQRRDFTDYPGTFWRRAEPGGCEGEFLSLLSILSDFVQRGGSWMRKREGVFKHRAECPSLHCHRLMAFLGLPPRHSCLPWLRICWPGTLSGLGVSPIKLA